MRKPGFGSVRSGPWYRSAARDERCRRIERRLVGIVARRLFWRLLRVLFGGVVGIVVGIVFRIVVRSVARLGSSRRRRRAGRDRCRLGNTR
jgi:hypothetical protein